MLKDSRPITGISRIYESGLKKNTAKGGVLEITYVFDRPSRDLEGYYSCTVGDDPMDEQLSYSFYVHIM